MRFGFACGLACGFACVLVGVICAADVEERRERVERAGRDEAVWDRPSSEHDVVDGGRVGRRARA